MVAGTRETTFVPSQSLYWLNSAPVQQLSEAIARCVLGLSPPSDMTPAVESTGDPRGLARGRFAGRQNQMALGRMI